MNQNQNKGEIKAVPSWYADSKMDELAFLEAVRRPNGYCHLGRRFYDRWEKEVPASQVQSEIVEELSKVWCSDLNRKSQNLLSLARILWDFRVSEENDVFIHFKNGSYNTWMGTLSREPVFTLRRMQADYDPNAPEPECFLRFLGDLLYPEDIPTLQEYLGYCMLPTTKGQKMMILMGQGGEGKSVLGQVVADLWGEGAVFNSVQKIATDRFARADLEGKLLMVDDDMSLEALAKTHYLKTLVTLNGKTDVERKGLQSYQAKLHCRFLGFSNGTLSALYDRSYGFYRRLLLLQTRPRPADRKDDPYMVERMRYEQSGIINWCLEGLGRLLEHHYVFTVSDRARANLQQAIREADPIPEFLNSQGCIRFDENGSISTGDLYDAYREFCQDNSLVVMSSDSFQRRVKELLLKRGVQPTSHVPYKKPKSIRGYLGLRLDMQNGW